MAAGDGDGVDRLLPQLVGELLQLRGREPAQIGGPADSVEKRCFDRQGAPSVGLSKYRRGLHNAAKARNATGPRKAHAFDHRTASRMQADVYEPPRDVSGYQSRKHGRNVAFAVHERNDGRRDLTPFGDCLHARHRNELTGRTETVVRRPAKAVVRRPDPEVKRGVARLSRDVSAAELLHLLVGIEEDRASAAIAVAFGLVGERMRGRRGEKHRGRESRETKMRRS